MAEDAAARAKSMYLFTARTPSPEAPAIISTQPLDAAAQTEWREDLNVMDKILRDEMGRAGVDGGMRAMGIKLTMIGQTAPTYVENCGVIFTSAVNWPLAPSGGASGNKDDRPRAPDSPWERAKRELNGATSEPKGRRPEAPPPAFDQAKLDDLVSAIVKVLPQATNFRHLGEQEFVFVTVVGADEGGNPLRLTLKAKKADIDRAARGQVSPPDFAALVTRRIG
jgi:hypothetical protein